MSIDRLVRMSVKIAVCGLLTACGGSGFTSGGQDMPSAYQRAVLASQGTQNAARPNASSCSQLERHAKLKPTETTIRFPADCGVTGDIRIPAVTNLQSPPQSMSLCENASPIDSIGEHRGCTRSESDANCQQAKSTFWYQTLTLRGEGPGETSFAERTFPVKFTSSTFIVAGEVYGLCVVDEQLETIIQDDFVSGRAVAPNSDTIKLKIALPASYDSSFPNYDALDLFFESKPNS